jgi:large subunit ribosomal protein L6
MPIMLPAGVKLHVNDGVLRAEGPKGKLQRRLEPEITVTIEGNKATLLRRDDSRRAKSLHGLTRVLVANMV